MRAPDLVVGARYIIRRAGGVSATYEGKHDGKMTLADGSTYFGGNNTLRFRYKNASGDEQIALLESGSEVEEAEATKLERERIVAEREAVEAKLMQEARALLESLGLTIVKQSYDVRGSADPSVTVALNLRYPGGRGAGAEIEIEEFTVNKLKLALSKAGSLTHRADGSPSLRPESAELA